MNNWFGKLVKFNPTVALAVGRTILVVVYILIAPTEAIYRLIIESFKYVVRIYKAFIKPFRNFKDEWDAVKIEVEYFKDNNE